MVGSADVRRDDRGRLRRNNSADVGSKDGFAGIANWHGGRLGVQVMLGRRRPVLGACRTCDHRERRRNHMQSVDDVSASVAATVVLAEDDPDLRAMYALCLRRAGHVVWEAADGAQALALVRSRSPQLLLLDIWMPILNGLEVLERLTGVPEAVGLKVVVLSHQSDADSRLEGFALGVVDYWTKDMSVVDLGDRVLQIMRPTPTASIRPG